MVSSIVLLLNIMGHNMVFIHVTGFTGFPYEIIICVKKLHTLFNVLSVCLSILKSQNHILERVIEGRSKKYEELQPVYLLSILDHVFDAGSEEWLHRYSLINEEDFDKKMTGIHLIFLELGKCRKLSNFNLQNIQERWITFLTEPEKIIAMSKHEIHEYPNLLKAVELLDESNYTPGQLLAYERYMDGIISWNSTMVESFDNGFEEGMEKGIEKGMEKGINKGMKEGINQSIFILQQLKASQKSAEEIAKDFEVSLDTVLALKALL